MANEPKPRVLIVGGSGVFGSRLAEGLTRDGHAEIILAARGVDRAQSIAQRLRCRSIAFDLFADDMPSQLAKLEPNIVIDAAGPFQAYATRPYRLAQAAIAIGAHYLDLSDDGLFTKGITTCDEKAKVAGVAVLSGVSSVPAISAAAVRSLSAGLRDIHFIESAILPGNRAPRGRSVMRSILSQVGRTIPGTSEKGWIGTELIKIQTNEGMICRLASPIGAPDLVLMPAAFNTREVRFLAGLEISLMHRGLSVLAWLVNKGFLTSALPFASVLWPAALALQPFGSDLGGMRVRLVGTDRTGQRTERMWSLLAAAGDGPHVPTIPGRVLVRKLIREEVPAGARPAIDALSLQEIRMGAPERALSFSQVTRPWSSVFRSCLGSSFEDLPKPVQALHDVIHRRVWIGEASVDRGNGLMSQLLARLFRFPPATSRAQVTVEMKRDGHGETWRRTFGSHHFRSHLIPDTAKAGRMWERFGPFHFAIDLSADHTGLEYPVNAGRIFKLPLPRALLPISDTREGVDEMGRVTFDVSLSLPLVGHVVRYRGWLVPGDQPINGDQSSAAAS